MSQKILDQDEIDLLEDASEKWEKDYRDSIESDMDLAEKEDSARLKEVVDSLNFMNRWNK